MYIVDKENKDNSEKIKDLKRKIKKLKETNKMITKKINDMKERDLKIDTMLFDKDLIISS
jgi:cell division protein FtsB